MEAGACTVLIAPYSVGADPSVCTCMESRVWCRSSRTMLELSSVEGLATV